MQYTSPRPYLDRTISMQQFTPKTILLSLVVLAILSGCSILGGKDEDETESWSANKLYDSAKAAMAAIDGSH